MEAIESGTASALHGLTLNIPKTSANVSAGAASLAYWATQILKKSVHDRRFEHLRPGVPVFDGSEKVEEKSPAEQKRRERIKTLNLGGNMRAKRSKRKLENGENDSDWALASTRKLLKLCTNKGKHMLKFT